MDFLGLQYNIVCIRDATAGLCKRGVGAIAPLLQELDAVEGSVTVGHLQQKFGDDVIQMGIAAGALGCDLKAGVLAPTTEVWPAYGDLSHLCVFELEL